MRKLAYIFGIALFLFGCGGKQFLHIGYDPTDSIQPFFKLGGKQPILYIDPVIDNRKNAEGGIIVGVTVWKSGKFQDDPRLIYTWTSALLQTWLYHTSKTPQEIIRDSLETQVRRLGIKVTQDQSKADGTLKASIEKFYYPPTITGSEILVAIDLNLYKTGVDSPIWNSKLMGKPGVSGTTLSTVSKSDGEKGLNRALINAMKKWQNRYDFQEAMANLSGINFSQSSPQPHKEQTPKSGTGSGFFVSKMGHVITNAHVVKNCKKVTIGDNANKQVPAEIINTDRSNDLALLKLSTLEMASAESKSLIQKLGIVVVPLASKGLLRSEDVRLGEKVLVAGYPFGDVFSNTIKVTSGIVSATRGAGDDSGQFQLDAAVQPGNSGGPIYDSGGNIVGVVISQLDKLKVAKAIGSLPENVNFGIKASTVRQFLTSSGLPSKKSERTEEKSNEQLAEIAKNQALMVMCLQ